MGWTRETYEDQDPDDLDDLIDALTVRRIVLAPERALVYAQVGEAATAQMDLALHPYLLEGMTGGG